MRPVRLVILSLLVLALLAGARRRAVRPADPPLNLDVRRSFAVTDAVMLEGFGFQRVMEAIAARSGTRTTALELYRQMLDTQNPKPGLVAADAPHCDDFTVDGRPSFNGLPRRCPTPEGYLALTDPFASNEYVTLGVINRFDLTPPDGSNCGQYRVIFARTGTRDMLHLIFEAVLPNPNPPAGIAACRPVAQFWADLSRVDSIEERRTAMERFFFDGIDGFAPVFHPDHYSAASGGGIRSDHQTVSAGFAERFYQFRLARTCTSSECRLIAEPDVLDNSPFAPFFDASVDSPAARAFREEFIRQIPTLAIADANLYFMKVPRQFLLAESLPLDDELSFDLNGSFAKGLKTEAGQEFAKRIDAELKKAGSTMTPAQVVTRAATQSCVGCHVLSGPVGDGVTFPPPLGAATHVSEHMVGGGEGGQRRFLISEAMEKVFIPHRMEILRRFLASSTPPVHSN